MTTPPYKPVLFRDLPPHVQAEIRQGKGLLDRPPVEWQQIADEMTGDTAMMMTVEDALDGIIIRAGTMREYLRWRRYNHDHVRSLKGMNRFRTRIRRLLGFSYPSDPLTF
jgi:hypothetical protein